MVPPTRLMTRFLHQYGAFFLVVVALFVFYSTAYRSVIVQFDVESKGFGELQIDYAPSGQPYSSHDFKRVKVAPSTGHHVRLEISTRAPVERLRWSQIQGHANPTIKNLLFLTPRSGKNEDNPEIRAPQIVGIPEAAGDAVDFQLEGASTAEALIPSSLYTQPDYQWVELGALLIMYLVFALLLDAERLSAPWASPGADWGNFGLGISCLLLTALASHKITYGSIVGDAAENLSTAINLLHSGTYSHWHTNPPVPDNLREPVPNFLLAAWLAMVEIFDRIIEFNHLRGGAGAYAAKMVNIFWVYAGLVAFSKILFRLIPNLGIGLLGLLMVFIAFFGSAQWIDSLYTELQTGVLLLWLTVFSIRAVQEPRTRNFIGMGIFAGLLVLTKAIFLYVFAVLSLGWLAAWLRQRATAPWRGRGQGAAIAALTALCVIAPWSIRNAVQFASPNVSSVRAGGVMYFRALLDELDSAEIKGLIYLNGPTSYRLLSDHFTGSPERADYQRGGRWARLYIGPSNFQISDKVARKDGRPENAISLHQRSSAEFVKRIEAARSVNDTYPERAADQSMGKDAVTYILHHPWRHLLMSLPFFWAGFWGFGTGFFSGMWGAPWDRIINVGFDALNLAAGVALFLVLWKGIRQGNRRFLAIAAPSVLMIGAYTAVSQNLARFFGPTYPLMILCLMLLLFGGFWAETPSEGGSIR